ncbi:uncharacterized protein DSM5745_01959 [Aspergillus mulundensis]|uniref:Uncharacterized protein n=1 Tax=Aspergillus mulundensis TaxID=1810919 RepID=A0A3D8SV82_9EURO|nr:hypothetical protein DSM5745_01959 [Aspergillus mulundensis]RDW90184.1 hypothetical protein DSM5745_01959 [Aspergillus mulundensis]
MNGSEFSVHLVLRPSPANSSDSTRTVTNASYHSNRADAPSDNQLRSPETHAPQLRYREPNPLRRDEVAQSLHENATRRLAELQHDNAHSRFPWLRRSQLMSTQQLHRPPSYMPGPMGTAAPTSLPFAPLPNLPLADFGDDIQLPEETRARLRLLKQYISLAEEQINCGIAPSLDHVIQLRTHLFRLLDDQLRLDPSERGEFIEPLITRVFDISTRADELRRRHLFPDSRFSNRPTPPLYLVSSPNGYQAVCAPSVGTDGTRTPGTVRTVETTEGQQANLQPNADAVVMENVVRAAVLNQRPVADGQFGLGRNLRRLWLFMRLYFFCHMFSQPGSQTRLLYVTLSVIAAILSETSVPNRVYEMILVPVQRHLEGLVHFTPEEQVPPRPHGAEATSGRAATDRQVGVHPGRDARRAGGLYHNLRRVERSAALFIASLVPGVGERHIEVRNAAEAARNAELARQVEERRRQEEAAAADAATAEETSGEQRAQATTEAEANEPQPVIPQEVH